SLALTLWSCCTNVMTFRPRLGFFGERKGRCGTEGRIAHVQPRLPQQSRTDSLNGLNQDWRSRDVAHAHPVKIEVFPRTTNDTMSLVYGRKKANKASPIPLI